MIQQSGEIVIPNIYRSLSYPGCRFLYLHEIELSDLPANVRIATMLRQVKYLNLGAVVPADPVVCDIMMLEGIHLVEN